MALLLNTALLFMHNNMATSMDTMPNNCIVLVVVGFLMFQKKKKAQKNALCAASGDKPLDQRSPNCGWWAKSHSLAFI